MTVAGHKRRSPNGRERYLIEVNDILGHGWANLQAAHVSLPFSGVLDYRMGAYRRNADAGPALNVRAEARCTSFTLRWPRPCTKANRSILSSGAVACTPTG